MSCGWARMGILNGLFLLTLAELAHSLAKRTARDVMHCSEFRDSWLSSSQIVCVGFAEYG